MPAATAASDMTAASDRASASNNDTGATAFVTLYMLQATVAMCRNHRQQTKAEFEGTAAEAGDC